MNKFTLSPDEGRQVIQAHDYAISREFREKGEPIEVAPAGFGGMAAAYYCANLEGRCPAEPSLIQDWEAKIGESKIRLLEIAKSHPRLLLSMLTEIYLRVGLAQNHPLAAPKTPESGMEAWAFAREALKVLPTLDLKEMAELLFANQLVCRKTAKELEKHLRIMLPELQKELSGILSEKSRAFTMKEINAHVKERLSRINFTVRDPIAMLYSGPLGGEIEVLQMEGYYEPKRETVGVSAQSLPRDNKVANAALLRVIFAQTKPLHHNEEFRALYEVLLHELGHGVSTQYLSLLAEKENIEIPMLTKERKVAIATLLKDIEDLNIFPQDDFSLEPRRLGLRNVETGGFSWLDEAVIESITLEQSARKFGPHKSDERRPYEKERKIYDHLRSRVPEHLFVDAFIEGMRQGKKRPENLHWDALVAAIDQEFGPGYLNQLDASIRAEGMDAVLKSLQN